MFLRSPPSPLWSHTLGTQQHEHLSLFFSPLPNFADPIERQFTSISVLDRMYNYCWELIEGLFVPLEAMDKTQQQRLNHGCGLSVHKIHLSN